jgi:hypothetical protein
VSASAAADNDQSPEWATKVLAAMAAILTLISPAVASIAAAAGGLQRMLRNELPLTVTAAISIGAGFLFVLLAFIVLTSPSTKKNAYSARLFAGASILIVLGLGLGFWSAGQSAGLREEPSIAAGLINEPSLHLDATIHASGLRADERLNVHVTAYGRDPAKKIYLSVTGPDETGQVSLAITLPIAVGAYDRVLISVWHVGALEPDCNEAQAGARADAACALFQVPAGPAPTVPPH